MQWRDWLRARLDGRHEDGRIARNSGWLIADKVVRAVIGLPVAILLTRHLGTEGFGQWSYAMAWFAILSTAAGLGLDGIVVRQMVRQPKCTVTILSSALAMKLVAGAGAIAVGLTVVSFINGHDSVIIGLVSILAGSLLFQAMDVADYWFQAQVASRHVVLARTSAFIVCQLIKVGLIIADASLQAFAWAQLLESALVALLLYSTLARHAEKPLRLREFDSALSLAMLKDASPLLLAGISVVLYMRIDVLMLERLASPHEVGIYAAATRLSEFWYAIPMAWVASASPSLLAAHENDVATFERRMSGLYRGLFWLAALVATGTTLISGQLVSLLYGDGFEEAGPVLAVHVWAAIPVFLGVASSQFLLAENLQMLSLARTLLGLVVNLVLNLLLIPSFGAIGAAAATLVSYTVATMAIGLDNRSRGHAAGMLRAPFVSYSRYDR